MISIGIAVLGAGDVSAHVLISSLLNHKLGNISVFSVVAVWDADLKRAHDFATSFSLPLSACCCRGDDALTRHDVVVAAICGASPATQPALAAKAIHAGKHVLLVPGYPLAIDYAQNSNLIDALAAYPSLVCAVGSGFHYLPTFTRLRSELANKLQNCHGAVRSVSLSATASPKMLFGNHEWQADNASGGGALSQVGAPLLDSALSLLLQLSHEGKDKENKELTVVTVQGRTAQLLDDSTDFVSHSSRLWPRTAEDACWLQVDLKKRRFLDNSSHSENNNNRKPVLLQSVVSLDIVSSETLAECDSDPLLNVSVLADCSLRFKTDGHSLWFWARDAQSDPLIFSDNQGSDSESCVKRKSLLLESIRHFADLIASEFISNASSQIDNNNNNNNNVDSGVLFSTVLQSLLQSNRVVSVGVALATQKLIDSVRTSLLGTAVSLGEEVVQQTNHMSWSQCL